MIVAGVAALLLVKPPAIVSAAATGTISGVIKVNGTVPKGRSIDMAKEPSCAQQHPTPITTEQEVAGANGTLQNAVVYISEGLQGSNFPAKTEPVNDIALTSKPDDISPFLIFRELTTEFHGDWGPLKGRKTLYIWLLRSGVHVSGVRLTPT